MTASLLDRLGTLSAALLAAGVPHLLGGGLALAFHVAHPRETADIDIQVYPEGGPAQLLQVLPDGIEVSDSARAQLAGTGQARLRWGLYPVDVFLPVDAFHYGMRDRAVHVVLPGLPNGIDIISGTDLTIFKAMFDRPKDWVDIQAMLDFGSVDVAQAAGWLREFELGDRAERLELAAGQGYVHRTAASFSGPGRPRTSRSG